MAGKPESYRNRGNVFIILGGLLVVAVTYGVVDQALRPEYYASLPESNGMSGLAKYFLDLVTVTAAASALIGTGVWSRGRASRIEAAISDAGGDVEEVEAPEPQSSGGRSLLDRIGVQRTK